MSTSGSGNLWPRVLLPNLLKTQRPLISLIRNGRASHFDHMPRRLDQSVKATLVEILRGRPIVYYCRGNGADHTWSEGRDSTLTAIGPRR